MFRQFLPLAIVAAFFTPALAHAANDSVWYTQPNKNGGTIELLEGLCPAKLAAGMEPGLRLARSNTLNNPDLWGCWTADAGVVRIYWNISGSIESYSYASSSFTPTARVVAMIDVARAKREAADDPFRDLTIEKKPNPYADLDAETAQRQREVQKHKRARQPAAPISSNAL